MDNSEPYSYKVSSGTWVIREYQRKVRAKVQRGWLLVALVVYLLNLAWNSSNAVDPWEVSWSVMMTADAELAAATYANDWPGWVRWLAEVESEDEALEWMAVELDRLGMKGSLDEDGEDVRAAISALAAGENLERTDEEWQESYAEGVWAWERIAAARQFEDSPPTWWLEENEFYHSLNREKALLMSAGSAVWWLVLLVGLPFIPSACRCFRKANHVRLSPATRAWRPSAVTTRYIFTDIVTGLALVALYQIIPAAWWEDFFGPTLLVSDSIWRVGGPLLLCGTLLVRWRHAIRLLGMHLRPLMKPVLGMLSLGVIYNVLLYYTVGKFTSAESLDTLYSSEDGPWGLLFALVSGVILAPIFEEVVYRGILFQSYLRRFGFWVAMLFSTLFFVFIHFYGLSGSLSVAFFGIAACALYRATGSLWSGIVFHAVTNGLITATMWPVYHQW